MIDDDKLKDAYMVFHTLLKKCYEGDIVNRGICLFYAYTIKDCYDNLNNIKSEDDVSYFLKNYNEIIHDQCQRYLFDNNKALADFDISSQSR